MIPRNLDTLKNLYGNKAKFEKPSGKPWTDINFQCSGTDFRTTAYHESRYMLSVKRDTETEVYESTKGRLSTKEGPVVILYKRSTPIYADRDDFGAAEITLTVDGVQIKDIDEIQKAFEKVQERRTDFEEKFPLYFGKGIADLL